MNNTFFLILSYLRQHLNLIHLLPSFSTYLHLCSVTALILPFSSTPIIVLTFTCISLDYIFSPHVTPSLYMAGSRFTLHLLFQNISRPKSISKPPLSQFAPNKPAPLIMDSSSLLPQPQRPSYQLFVFLLRKASKRFWILSPLLNHSHQPRLTHQGETSAHLNNVSISRRLHDLQRCT